MEQEANIITSPVKYFLGLATGKQGSQWIHRLHGEGINDKDMFASGNLNKAYLWEVVMKRVGLCIDPYNRLARQLPAKGLKVR